MSELQPFVFPTTGQAVRTVTVDGEPWFVAADVTAILGYRMASDATRWLDEDEKGTHQLRTPGGEQVFTTVSEPGLYSLILRSNVEGAREFKRWVTHKVLPAIRKTGSYSLPAQPMDELELAQHNVRLILEKRAAEERADRAEFQVLELAPAARAWDTFREAHGDYSVREAAQILSRDPGIDTGQQRLFRCLREIGWLDRQNLPYQRQIDLGRLALRTSAWEKPSGDEQVSRQARITVKGIEELHKRLGGTARFDALISEEIAA